jgi:hypothetical protein
VPPINTERLRDALQERLTEWQRILRAEPTVARQILRKILPGRVTFEPAEGGTASTARRKLIRSSPA